MGKWTAQRLAALAASWLFVAAGAFGYDTFTEGGFVYETTRDSDRVDITGWEPILETTRGDTLHIPASVTHNGKEYKVSSIFIKALQGLTTVRSVVIGEGIESIWREAFAWSANLESVYIPASVTGVAGGAFAGCYNLKSIKVDPRNEDLDSRDNCNAVIYTEDDVLKAACPATRIPPSVKTIGEYAFVSCNTIEELIIPEGVTSIEDEAFGGCSSLRKVSLPQSLEKIGDYAFGRCRSLTSVFIPKNVKEIDEGNIFYKCDNLISIEVDAGNAVYDSRSGCNGIVRKADSALVATCRTTTIGNDISKLEYDCFAGANIHSVRIPKSVRTMSEIPFSVCYEIDSITVEEGNPAYISPQGSNAILTKDGKTLVFGCRTTVIPDGVKTIGNYAFAGNYTKEMLRLPDGIEEIGDGAFQNCQNLIEVIIPPSVKSLGYGAFSNCRELMVVKLSPILNGITQDTFSGCTKLTVVDIPEGITFVEKGAFRDCRNIRNLHLPASVVRYK